MTDRILAAQKFDRKSPPTTTGLRSPGWLAKWPIIGLAMFLVGSLAFGALAFNVKTHGPLLQWDVPVYKQLYGDATKEPPRTLELLTFGFFVGKELIQVIVVLLSVYFIYKRYWPELAMILIGSMGAAAIWTYVIHIFNRPRPSAQLGIVVGEFPSFPSGHTISAVICYGFLAYLLIPKMPSLFWKWVVAIVAILTMAYIGFSRISEGGHYLTDVIGGYAFGLAWAALVFTVIESLFLRRKTGS
jgi:membrane-associated phospholipid phosphatase